MSMEFIDSQTATDSTDFTDFTFSTAVDFADYSEMFCTFSFGTTSTSDIQVRVGDSGESGSLTTSTYNQQSSDNTGGTFTNETNSGENQWAVARHPRVASQNGCSGYVRVYLIRDSNDDTFLSFQSAVEGYESIFMASGWNTTVQTDLKYFRILVSANRNIAGNYVACYKLKRT